MPPRAGAARERRPARMGKGPAERAAELGRVPAKDPEAETVAWSTFGVPTTETLASGSALALLAEALAGSACTARPASKVREQPGRASGGRRQ